MTMKNGSATHFGYAGDDLMFLIIETVGKGRQVFWMGRNRKGWFHPVNNQATLPETYKPISEYKPEKV